ncbi:PAS domain S-box [Cylindrospermum stagnale PCC 7417]|uniref:histidine kinase n=1 Tax=Cylindrospermum stagnale PCC 7417 TaxID=56107 RepID=K9WTZ1_9NOST|nr:PAS domain S-box protein [Cylindrospermum stagnale]AFZ23658.1 PAS domain S-box [Cylindrospermum stagnale PCC 7417]
MQALPQHLVLQSLESVIDFSPLTVAPETSVLDAIALMAMRGKGVLVKSASLILGCFTEQDMVQLVASGVDFSTAKISEVMSTAMTVKVSDFDDLASILSLLLQDQLRLVPVIDHQGQFVGTITAESICQAMAAATAANKGKYEQTEERLRLLESVVVNANDAIIITEAVIPEEPFGLRILYVNAAFTRMSGYAVGEVMGKTPRILQGEQTSRTQLAKIRAALQAGLPIRTELINYHKNGSTYWVEINVVPIKDQQGKITHFVAVQRDITARKQTEEALRSSEELFQQLTKNIPQVFFVRDAKQHNLYYISPAYEKIWGRSADRLYENPQNYYESIHPQDRDRYIEAIENLKLGKSFNEAYRIFRPNGEMRWISEKTFPVSNDRGEVYRFTGIAEDITEHQQAFEALQASATRLTLALEATNTIYWERNLNNDRILFLSMVGEPGKTQEISYAEYLSGIHPDDRQDVDHANSLAIANLGSLEVEYRVLIEGQPSEYKWLLTRAIVLRDSTGQPTRLIGVSVDITDRVQAEAAIAESERRFRAIFNGTFQFTALLTPEGIVLETNQTALEFGGLQPEDVAGHRFWETRWWSIAPQTQNQLKEAIAIAASGEFVRYEVDALGADQTVRTVDFSLKPLTDETGLVMLLIAEGRDISDLKQAQADIQQANLELEMRVAERTIALEQINHQLVSEISDRQMVEAQLRQSQKMLQLIMDTIPHSIFWKDIDSVFLGCNRNFAKMAGFDNLEDIVGKTDYDLRFSQEEAHFYYSCDAEVMKTNTPQYQIITPQQQADGSQIWLETNKVPLHNTEGNVVGMLGTLENITARKQAQAALEKSEERFRFLAESIPQKVWITQANGSIEYVNQRTLDFFACNQEQIFGWEWHQWVHAEDQPRYMALWQKSIVTGTPLEIECRLLRGGDKNYLWHLIRALPLRDRQGKILNWFGTNTDIDDRVSAEVALRESERRYHTIATISPVGLFRTDAQGNCLYVNDRWSEITGLKKHQSAGVGWLAAIHPEDRERVIAEWHQAVSQNLLFRSEYRFQRPDGSLSWVFGQAVAERTDRGQAIAYIGTITDISQQQAALQERQRAEAALAERVRLADFRADVDAVLTQNENLESMMRGCTEALVKHLDATVARIWTLNKDEKVLELQVSSGIYTHIDDTHSRIPIGQFKIGLISQFGFAELSNTVQDDSPISNQEWAKQEGIIANACYPLIVEGETLGVIAMYCRQALTESTFKALLIAADAIAIGIKRKQTEAALQDSEERFRNLVEASSDWVWEVDENAVYTYVSPKVRDILGYEAEAVLGKTPLDFMPPEKLSIVAHAFTTVFATPQPFQCLENIQIHQHGHLVVLETSGVPVFDSEGTFRGYRGMSRDITQRQQEAAALRETQQQLQAILDNSPAVIYALDTQSRFMLVNRQYEKLFNITQEQIAGKSLYDVFLREFADKFMVNNHQVIAGGIPIETEEVAPHQDGLHTYLTVKFPLKDAHGVTYAVGGISTDITDRKRADEELRHSEECFRLLVEGVKDYAIYMLDPQGRVMSWNSGAECMTGYQAAEIIGQNFSCFFLPEEIAQALPKQQLELAAADGRCECESVFLRKDGSQFWANCILTALRDQTGKLRGFSKVTRDITERKLVEESLLRFRKAIESSSDAISMADITGEGIYVNPAFIELFQYTLEELQVAGGITVIFQKPQEHQKILATIQRGESWRGEVTMQTRCSQILQIYLRSDAIKDATGKIVGKVNIYTDITQRKQAEESLRLRDRAIAASRHGIVITDVTIPDKPLIYVNSAFERMTGYTAAEVIGQNCRLLQGADISQPELTYLRAAVQSGKDCTVILRNYRKDGSLFWNELNISPVYDTDGELTHYIGIQTDITERKQAETALLISQQRLQYLLSSSPAVIYTCKTSSNFGSIFVSENVTAMMGYEAREFVEDSNFWFSHIHPEDSPQVLAKLSKVLEVGSYSLEYRFLHQDNTYRWIYDQGKVVRDEIGNPLELVGYWADITNRKQLEQELRVALDKQKELNELKSRFVSMTSHEFRTPLSTILSSSELLEHYSHKWTQEKQLTHLHRIQTAVKRMTEMLNDVLVIGKVEAGRLEYRPTHFDLVEYCRQLVEEMQMNLSNHNLISFTSDYESMPCCMDDKLLGHILSNLLSNAIKYSPDSSTGKFTLTCQDGRAVLEIQDQGIGIPEEDLPRLFESFHRARNVGNILGTGLGLAIVKNCVEIHQGDIFVISTLGVGTKFTVNLPLNNSIQTEDDYAQDFSN